MKLYSDGNLYANEFIEGTGLITLISGVGLSVAPSPNLIINGLGEMGDNTNFTNFTYYTDDYYIPPGCFYEAGNSQGPNVGYIEVDPNNVYELRGLFKSVGPGGLSKLYYGIVDYDSDLSVIGHNNVHYYTNTTTILDKDLNDGDTIVYLASAANWKTAANPAANRYVGVWVPNDGYPNYTYTRRIRAFNDSSVISGTVTLSAAWNLGTIASGSAAANMFAGGTFQYLAASNQTVPSGVWTEYMRSGLTGWNVYGGVSDTLSSFRYGTRYIRLLFLANYAQDASYALLMDRLIFQNLSRSQSPPQKFSMASSSGVLANEFIEVGPVDDLLGYWRLDGDVLDYSGRGNDGTITGSPTVVSGIIDEAYYFNSTNNWGIDCGNFAVSASGFSMCAWINAIGFGDHQGVIGNHYHTAPCYGSNIYVVAGSGRIRISAGDGVGNRPTFEWNPGTTSGTWHHLAATYSGTTYSTGVFTAYYDGTKLSPTWNATLAQNNTPWVLARWASTYTDYVLEGSIDDSRVYNRTLSDAEVDTLYRLGIGTLRMRELLYKDLYLKDHYRIFVKKELEEI